MCRNDKIAKSLVIIFVIFIALPPKHSFSGSGRLEGGRFNLSISIRFNANATKINTLRDRFQQASELLFDATDGQHQFGTIRVCNNSRGGKNADIWILPGASPAGCGDGIDNDGDGRIDEELADGRDEDGDGRIDEDVACVKSYVTGDYKERPGLGVPNHQIRLFEDEALTFSNANADGRHVIAHLFGHHGYGIFEEAVRQDGSTVAACLEPTAQGVFTSQASLMENFWLRPTSEFCVAQNHDPDGDTWQDAMRGESSWETMVRFFPDLTIPAGLPVEAPPAGAATINWMELRPETRLVLVIDRSGSMGGDPGSDPNKIANAKLGAKLYTDLVSVGDRLGVVSFSDAATVDFPLTAVADETKDAAKAAIDRITSSGATNIGGALRTALNQILAAGDPACQQVVVLLSNGQQNTGEDPSTVLPDLRNAGVIVHTIGLGADADVTTLQNIATQTKGRFFPVPKDPKDLASAYSTLFSESTENGGLITSALIPVMTGSLTSDALIPMMIGELKEETVAIDSLTSEATFLISWPGVADFDLTLVRPDGVVITPATADTDPTVTFTSDTNHELYTVRSPQPGQWIMRIQAVSVTEPVVVTAQALSVSAEISFTTTPNKESFVFPEAVLVHANPTASVNVVGATVTGTVIRPDESLVPLGLFDDGLDIHGDLSANDGVYSNFFSAFNEDGTYKFEIVATVSNGFLFTGEGLFAFLELGFIPPQGASNVPAPTFTRTAGFSVTVSGAPLVIPVSIDIEPGEFPNRISISRDPNRIEVTTVAILTTPTFDASTLDPTTVRFGKTGTEATPVQATLADANGDSMLDLVLRFRTQDTGLQCGDTSAVLTGKTVSGQAIQGSDAIVTVRGGVICP